MQSIFDINILRNRGGIVAGVRDRIGSHHQRVAVVIDGHVGIRHGDGTHQVAVGDGQTGSFQFCHGGVSRGQSVSAGRICIDGNVSKRTHYFRINVIIDDQILGDGSRIAAGVRHRIGSHIRAAAQCGEGISGGSQSKMCNIAAVVFDRCTSL